MVKAMVLKAMMVKALGRGTLASARGKTSVAKQKCEFRGANKPTVDAAKCCSLAPLRARILTRKGVRSIDDGMPNKNKTAGGKS